MEYETYADVIDAYNADNMGYSSLTDYIKDQNIKIKEIEMDPIGDMRRIFESKADGGSIGIEVLFTDKMKNGGRVPAVSGGFLKLLAEGASKGKKGIMELVESGKGRFDEFVETMNQSKKPSELIDSVDIPKYLIKSDEPMTLAKMNLDRKTIDTIENTYKLGLYDEMPEVIKAKNLLESFTKPVGSVGLGTSDRVIDYKRAEDILNVKLNGDETIDDLFEIEFRTRPDKIPDQGLADGGRVGLFMGGDPLTGQALAIYNSMNAYGFDDQAIANALEGQGLYTAGGGGGGGEQETGIINKNINTFSGGDGITSIAPGTLQKQYQAQLNNPINNYLYEMGAKYKASDFGKKVGNIGSMAMGALTGIPGLGFLLDKIGQPGFNRGNIREMNTPKTLDATKFSDTSGINTDFGGVAVDDLGRIVQTGDYLTAENVMAGYNTGFDLTGTAFDRIDKINASALKRGVPVSDYNLRKIKALKDFAASSAKSRKDALQAEIERAQRIKDEAAREAATQAARVKSISEGYGGHDDSPGATGPTATGAGMGAGGGYQTDYGFIKDGGIAQDAPKGLATMFTREAIVATKSEVLKLLNEIQPYTGATQVGVSTKKNRAPEKAFLKAFNAYVDKEFFGNKSAALRALGINREKFRGIEARTLGDIDRRIGNIGKGGVMQTTTRTPKNVKPLTEITTNLKKDKNLLKKLVSKTNKNKFYTPKDIANIIGADVSNKRKLDSLVADLKRFNVDTVEKSGQQKLYKFGDTVNKLTKGYFGTKLVKGDRKAQTNRGNIISKIDKPLENFIVNTNSKLRNISKDLDIYVPNAVEDVGHPMSVKITDKFPKLFKDSNINKISTLMFQDPIINQKLIEATGYESKHEKLFKELNKFVDKKITPESQSKIINIKKEMNSLYDDIILDINNLSKTNSYFKGQETRIPKINLDVPVVGDTFKSANIFADMSVVDDSYRVGQVDKINSSAQKLNDLSTAEKKLYEETFVNQSKNNLEKFYIKSGFPTNDVKELSEAIDIGTDSRLPVVAIEAYDKADAAGKIKLENRIGCKRGCFVKTVTEEPQKLIRLFRGEPFKPRNKESIKALAKRFNVSEAEASKRVLGGQFFSANPDLARGYTGNTFMDNFGRTKYVDLTPKEFQDTKRYVERINKTNDVGGGTRFPVSRRNDGNNIQIMPRRKLKQLEDTGRMKSKMTMFGNVDTPPGTLKYDSVKGGFIDPADPTKIVDQAQITAWAQENPMPVRVGEEPLKVATNKSVLKNVGRTLATIGAPLPTALIDGYFINEQVKEGKGTAEIASNPLNWLGLATMSTLSDISGVSKPGKLNAALRLGLNPGTIRGISRFAGLPGLAVSTALTAYDQYKKYQNEEGFIYNLFNKEEK